MKVLIAEDDAVSRMILRRSVAHLGHACEVASDGAEAWEKFEASRPDVVISDWVMPGMDGIDFCRRVREKDALGYTYFVFMTSRSDKASFLQGMRAGADDYLTKPIDREELEARLLSAERVTGLHQRLAEQNASLERFGRLSHEAARTDPLTQLGNRLRLRDDLDTLRARAERYGHRYAVALCDVDHFKKYNDHHGHLAGDEVLACVARTISGSVRAGDSVYRFGGEEFLVILAEPTVAGATIAMERTRAAVEALALPNLGVAASPPAVVTLSIGLASAGRDDLISTGGWIKRADEALYRAKALGRNRVCAWEGDAELEAEPRT